MEGLNHSISPELLQNLQTAVGTSGVIGQVQTIETENGPMTVIIMEEGADATGETTVNGQSLLQTSAAGQEQLQYQIIQSEPNYTTQVLDTGQQNTVETTVVSSDTILDTGNVTMTVGDSLQTNTTTDTYYITDTGEIVKIEGSVVSEAELPQQTILQTDTTTDASIESQVQLPEETILQTDASNGGAIISETQIPQETILQTDTTDVLPQGQTIFQTIEEPASQTIISDPVTEQIALSTPLDAFGQTINQGIVSSSAFTGLEQTVLQPEVITQDSFSHLTQDQAVLETISALSQLQQNQPPAVRTLSVPDTQVHLVSSEINVPSTVMTNTAIPEFTAVKIPNESLPGQPKYQRSILPNKVERKSVGSQIMYAPKPASNLRIVPSSFTSKSSSVKRPEFGTFRVRKIGENTVLEPIFPTTSGVKQDQSYSKKTLVPKIGMPKVVQPSPQARQPLQGLKTLLKAPGNVAKTIQPRQSTSTTQYTVGSQTYRFTNVNKVPSNQVTMKPQPKQQAISTVITSSRPVLPKQTGNKVTQATQSDYDPPSPASQLVDLFKKEPVKQVPASNVQIVTKPQRTVPVATSIMVSPVDESKFASTDLLSSAMQEADVQLEESTETETILAAEDSNKGDPTIPDTFTDMLPESEAMETEENLPQTDIGIETSGVVEKMDEGTTQEQQAVKADEKVVVTSQSTGISFAPVRATPSTSTETMIATKLPPDQTLIATKAPKETPIVTKKAVPSAPATMTTTAVIPPGIQSQKVKSIDVPDSDVTIQLYADGTLVTKDRSGTNFSQVKLEDLGLDQDMLSGNTDIELLIVQGDGKEVRATLNTNILNKTLKPGNIVDSKQTINKIDSQQTLNKVENRQTINKVENRQTINKVESIQTMTPTDTNKFPIAKPVFRSEPDNAPVNELRPYKCSMCPRTFKFYKTFRCHEIVHTKSDIFTCHLCKRVFARETNLASHLELHEKKAALTHPDHPNIKNRKLVDDVMKGEYSCEICLNILTSYSSLKEHMQQEHGLSLTHVCTICDHSFTSTEKLNRHQLIHNGPFTCCGSLFIDRALYINHVTNKHPKKLLVCSICFKTMVFASDFTSHVKYVHADESPQVKQVLLDSVFDAECKQCGKKMMSTQLKQHMAENHMESDVRCPYCTYLAPDESEMKQHFLDVHQKEDFKCEKCDTDFEKLKELVFHHKIEHLSPYYCSDCREKFETRSVMEEHQNKIHGISFPCRLCLKRFTFSHEALKHALGHQKADEPCLCDECGTMFKTKEQLKQHYVTQHYDGDWKLFLKSHPNMKEALFKVMCPVCGDSGYKTKLGLATHISTIHFDGDFQAACACFIFLYSYPCPSDVVRCGTCGKTFSHMVYLKMHIKTHLEPKPKPKTTPVKKVKMKQKSDSEDDDDDEDDKVDLDNIEPRVVEKKYQCEQCSSYYARKASLKRHINEKHKKDIFKQALKDIEKEETARAEAEEREGLEKKGSKVTNIPRKRENSVPKVFTKSPRQPKKHICQVCEEVFKTAADLKKHIKDEHIDPDDEYSGEVDIPDEDELVENANASSVSKESPNQKSSQNSLSKRKRGRPLGSTKKKSAQSTLDDTLDGDANESKEKGPDQKEKSDATPGSQEKRKPGRPFGSTKKKIAEQKAKRKIEIKSKKDQNKRQSIDLEMTVESIDDMEVDNSEEPDDITSFLGRNFNLGKKDSDTEDGSPVKRKYKCQTCGQTFSRETTLKKHQHFHDEAENSDCDELNLEDLQVAKYCCPSCSNTYSTASGLVFHNRKKHPEADEEEVLIYIEEVDKKIKILEATSHKSGTTTKSKKRKLSVVESPIIPKRTKVEEGEYTNSGRKVKKTAKRNEQVQCNICKKYFDLEDSLKRHIFMVHTDRKAPMKLTPKKTKSEVDSGDNVCPICKKIYDLEINLRRHMLMKHKKSLDHVLQKQTSSETSTPAHLGYKCDICGEEFTIITALQDHMTQAHDEKEACDEKGAEKEALVCKECDCEFASVLSMQLHMRKHTGESPYNCCICKAGFVLKYALDTHLSKMHPREYRSKARCRICLMMFDGEAERMEHMTVHQKKATDDKEIKHKCGICEKDFAWRKNLAAHKRRCHNTDTKICGVCNKFFPDVKSVTDHMKVHSKPKDGIYKCQYCGKGFAKTSSLRMHETVSHKLTGTAMLSCNICNTSFTTKGDLLEHMMTHTSINPHNVSKSDESFKQETELGANQRDSKSPARAQKLQTEMKKKGTPKSEDSIKSKVALKKEIPAPKSQKTTGAFGCSKCKKKFTKLWQLNAHKREAHKGLYKNLAQKKKTQILVTSIIQTRRQSAASYSSDQEKRPPSKQKMPKLQPSKSAAKGNIKVAPKTASAKSMPKLKPEGKPVSKLTRLRNHATKAVKPDLKKSVKGHATKAVKPELKKNVKEHATKAVKQNPKKNVKSTMMNTAKVGAELKSRLVHVKELPSCKRPVPCPICSKILSKRSHLKIHIRNVHKEDPDKVMSPTVAKVEPKTEEATRITPIMSPKGTKRVKCRYCNVCAKMYWSQQQYENHIREKHPDKVALDLDKQVMEHIKQEAMSPRPDYSNQEYMDFETVQQKCEFCNDVLLGKTALNKHILDFHPDHAEEYKLSTTSPSKLQTIPADPNTDDPENYLNVEVYQNIACEKLASSPIVMIEKISKEYSIRAKTDEVNEKVAEGIEMDEDDVSKEGSVELEATNEDKQTMEHTDNSESPISGKQTMEDIDSPETNTNKPSSDLENEMEVDNDDMESTDVNEIQKQAMDIELDYGDDILLIDVGQNVSGLSEDTKNEEYEAMTGTDDSLIENEPINEGNERGNIESKGHVPIDDENEENAPIYKEIQESGENIERQFEVQSSEGAAVEETNQDEQVNYEDKEHRAVIEESESIYEELKEDGEETIDNQFEELSAGVPVEQLSQNEQVTEESRENEMENEGTGSILEDNKQEMGSQIEDLNDIGVPIEPVDQDEQITQGSKENEQLSEENVNIDEETEQVGNERKENEQDVTEDESGLEEKIESQFEEVNDVDVPVEQVNQDEQIPDERKGKEMNW